MKRLLAPSRIAVLAILLAAHPLVHAQASGADSATTGTPAPKPFEELDTNADGAISKDEAAADPALVQLFGTLDKLKQSAGGSASEMARLFPNVRGLAGASSLLGDGLKSATDNLRQMETAGRDFAHGRYLEAISNDGEKVRKEFNEIKNVFVTDVLVLVPTD